MTTTIHQSRGFLAILGTVTLTVLSCAPDDGMDPPPEASDPELEFQQQLDALRFAVEYVAERAGRERVSLAIRSEGFSERGANVFRDQGRSEEEVIRRLAEELGPGFEPMRFEERVRDEPLSCPEGSDSCWGTEGAPIYEVTLQEFSGDRATVGISVYGPDSTWESSREMYLQHTPEGWALVNAKVMTW